jgi:hypothetical protein
MGNCLTDYFRLPDDSSDLCFHSESSGGRGFFRFGRHAICYGEYKNAVSLQNGHQALFDASTDVVIENGTIHFPFNPDTLIDNLRHERYKQALTLVADKRMLKHPLIRGGYYAIRELLPVFIRRQLQKIYFSDWQRLPFPTWPVDCTVDSFHCELLRLYIKARGLERAPFIWFWPEGAPSCLIMTHDVETASGVAFTPRLMDLDDRYGLKASFQVIPESRYTFSEEFVSNIRNRGFEFNIHDLNHDGQLFKEHSEFVRRAARINQYAEKYAARGFRSGAMYRNQEWFGAFTFSYDMSVPNVAHLEPMRGGCCTVMPYFVGDLLEIPLTTAQDYTILHILNEETIDLWKVQIDLILRQNGLISFISHPDYLIDRRARNVYETLLGYVKQLIAKNKLWSPLPCELNDWWRARSQMRLTGQGNNWTIEGPQSERARVAFARDDGNRLIYEFV